MKEKKRIASDPIPVSGNAMSEVESTVIPEGLCGKKGARFDGAPPTGGCVFLKGHEDPQHSWERGKTS